MRMRRKKNLPRRLEECGDLLLPCQTQVLDFSLEEGGRLFDMVKVFGRSAPLVLEIGCGQGAFACEFARRHPELNIIAVEKVPNVIVKAAETARDSGLKNLRFMCTAAEYLPRFIPAGSVSHIYLNFSCPFPKAKYAKHRLTHPRFLEIYKRLMAPGAAITQKTDNMHFFEFSLEQLSQCGFLLSNISLDLHALEEPDNIVTEYEARFSSMGCPIYRLEARPAVGRE